MRSLIACAAVVFALPAAAGAQTWVDGEVAVLQTLDKITARSRDLEAPVGQPVAFGALEIVVRACRKRPPEEPPESAAFLQIDETAPDEPPQRIFSGWMFASSPALSALEHPIYDVRVLDCKKAEKSDSSSSG